MTGIRFLPGISGAGEFWHGVGALLPKDWPKTYISWPCMGEQPHDENVKSFEDLRDLALAGLTAPAAFVAQSMGGVVAMLAALARPELIRAIVLTATSGGLDMEKYGAIDWRPGFKARFPATADWVFEQKPILTEQLSSIAAPVLLIRATEDPISPLAVGQALHEILPNSRLVSITSADHALAKARPELVAPHIEEFLRQFAE